jgi:hypothetical protein
LKQWAGGIPLPSNIPLTEDPISHGEYLVRMPLWKRWKTPQFSWLRAPQLVAYGLVDDRATVARLDAYEPLADSPERQLSS